MMDCALGRDLKIEALFAEIDRIGARNPSSPAQSPESWALSRGGGGVCWR
jgi:hypothetical protein